jgi:hypothetical protein
MISTQKHQDHVAPVMANDEPEYSSVQNVLIILAIVIGSIIVGLVLYYFIVKRSNNVVHVQAKTTIHDTIIVHDTIRVDHSPITYVCQGICDGVAGFERN